MSDWFFNSDFSSSPVDPWSVLLGLILAFLAGQLVAWVYMMTHSGLSYSRTFVNSLVVMPVLVALVMMVLSNNLVTAFGMMAVFAIVRFRNILRDTLDTTYILTVLVIGMACGTQRYPIAVLGCLLASGLLLYLRLTHFGERQRYDLILNLRWDRPLAESPELDALLSRHALRVYGASQRMQEGLPGADLSFRLLLRDPAKAGMLLGELRALPGVSRVTSLAADNESEA